MTEGSVVIRQRKDRDGLQVQVYAGRVPLTGRKRWVSRQVPGKARLATLARAGRHPAATAEDPELGLFLRLALVLGARRGELCALRWSEVDPNQGEVLIVGAVVRRLARRLGVRARLHDLRHFMVTQLVAGGVDWRTVSGHAGHADGHMTLATYAHFQQAQDRQAVEFMESLLAPPARPDARLR